MNRRRDAFKAAGLMPQAIYNIAKRHNGLCTIGNCVTKPGIPTSVVEDCTITLDQRHLDKEELAGMWADAQEAAKKFAKQCHVDVKFGDLWRIEPVLFNRELIDYCNDIIKEVAGKSYRLPSGPLHDAVEVCRAGIPTEMVFVQSLKGISHSKMEDTKEEHLEMSVTALANIGGKNNGLDSKSPEMRGKRTWFFMFLGSFFNRMVGPFLYLAIFPILYPRDFLAPQ